MSPKFVSSWALNPITDVIYVIFLTLHHHSTTSRKRAPFVWNQECEDAFITLKQHLTQTPVLAYPRFDDQANEFSLQTDVSTDGLGAVLEHDGHLIAYARQSLTIAERQYSVIQ